MSLRLYVLLKRPNETPQQHKRMIITVQSEAEVSFLKRKIETESSELFPGEYPFICGNLEDEEGFRLTNSCQVGNLLKNDSKVFAFAEVPNSVSATKPEDLISTLDNSQLIISKKLSESPLKSLPPEAFFLNLVPLIFTFNETTVQNTCVALAKGVETLDYLNQHQNAMRMFISAMRYLVLDKVQSNEVIQACVVEILEKAVRNNNFNTGFKSSSVMGKLMEVSKTTSDTQKSRVTRILTALSGAQITREENPHTLGEYFRMLESTQDVSMIEFALSNLESNIEGAVEVAASSPSLFNSALKIVDHEIPPNKQNTAYSVLRGLSENLNSKVAVEAVSNKALSKLYKAYKTQSRQIQLAIGNLMEQLLLKGIKALDVLSAVGLAGSSNPLFQEMGMKALASITDPSSHIQDLEFENHLRFLVKACTAQNASEEYLISALESLANLSLRDYLKSQLVNTGCLNTLLSIVKEPSTLESQRYASKALLNLTATKRELRARVISELSDLVSKLYRNELDGIVSTYLQTLVSGSIR